MTTEKKVRIDKWLWAARFFKTRSTATTAVNGGKVHINGQRTKAARVVLLGDQLRIQRGVQEFVVVVIGINDKRRPAKEAVTLYEETVESVEARAAQSEERRLRRVLSGGGTPAPERRPGKRDRRLIRSFTRKD